MTTCTRIESHIIKNSKTLDDLSFCSKNLYNQANYRVRQKFLETSRLKSKDKLENAIYLGYQDIETQMKDIEEYKELTAQTRQSILRLLDKNWKSFFKSIIEVKIVKESYTSKIDHLASEEMKHQENYKGKRIKRGLFKSSTGVLLNVDINGALGKWRLRHFKKSKSSFQRVFKNFRK